VQITRRALLIQLAFLDNVIRIIPFGICIFRCTKVNFTQIKTKIPRLIVLQTREKKSNVMANHGKLAVSGVITHHSFNCRMVLQQPYTNPESIFTGASQIVAGTAVWAPTAHPLFRDAVPTPTPHIRRLQNFIFLFYNILKQYINHILFILYSIIHTIKQIVLKLFIQSNK
jgi:hypothetical protein